MVVSSMAILVLRLCSRRGVTADERYMATAVPVAVVRRFATFCMLSGVALCGAMQARASLCCIDATRDATTAATRELVQNTPPTALRAGEAPSETVAIDAFLAARTWLTADALPALDETSARVVLENTSAVCVLLRLNGRVVGVGEDATGDALMLRRAVGRAVAKALGDETIRSVRATLGDKVTTRLALELELAAAPLPLLGRTIADAAARVVPGQDGLAVRRADLIVRAFPSRLAASDNADKPAGTITALLIDAGLPAKDLNEYAAHDRVSLARFATIRLREASPNATPEVITRGGRTIELVEITTASIEVLAAQLTTRLAGQVTTDGTAGAANSKLLGTLNPTADLYDPPFADTRQTALAALALGEASRCAPLAEAIRTNAAAKSLALVRTLCVLPETERTPTLDALCALALSATGATDADATALRTQLSARVQARCAALTTIDETQSPVAAAFTAAASAALGGEEHLKDAARLARTLLSTYHERPAALLQAALPLAFLASNPALDPIVAQEIRAAVARVAAPVLARQVGADPALSAGMPLDLIGGLLPVAGPRLGLETDCLRHAAAFAWAFPSGTVGSPPDLALATRRSMRYLAQHMAQDPWVGGFQRPETVRGLVRAALSGDDCPPEPTIVGLLLSTAALRSR